MGAFTALGPLPIMNVVNTRQRIKLPAITTAGSFLVIILLGVFTSPVKDITYAALFFVVLMIFLVGVGFLAVNLQTGRVTSKNRRRILIISASFLVLIMFRSAQSLSWVDVSTLILIAIGLLFYSDRRAY